MPQPWQRRRAVIAAVARRAVVAIRADTTKRRDAHAVTRRYHRGHFLKATSRRRPDRRGAGAAQIRQAKVVAAGMALGRPGGSSAT